MPYTGNDEIEILQQIESFGLAVYEAEMPEDSELVYDEYGAFEPFYVVTFGSPFTIQSERSFNALNKDPYRVYVIVQTVAPDPTTLRTHRVNVFNALSGFVPDNNSGEVKPEFGRYFTFGSNTVRPTQYGHSTMYSYMTNIISE